MVEWKRLVGRAVRAAVVYGCLFLMVRDLGKSKPVSHVVAAVGVLQIGLLIAGLKVGRVLVARHRTPRRTGVGLEADYDDG